MVAPPPGRLTRPGGRQEPAPAGAAGGAGGADQPRRDQGAVADGGGDAQARDALTAALARSLGPGMVQAPVALSLSTIAAIRAAVLAGAAPAVLSDLAVSDDIARGRLVEVAVPGLDLRRSLRAVWRGSAVLPAGPVRDLVSHILSGRPGPGQPPPAS